MIEGDRQGAGGGHNEGVMMKQNQLQRISQLTPHHNSIRAVHCQKLAVIHGVVMKIVVVRVGVVGPE